MENLLERSVSIQLRDGSVVELDQYSRNLILQSLHEMSSSALRCLGFAYKEDPPHFASYNSNEDHPAHELLLNPGNYSLIESGLTFVGFVGLRVSLCGLFVSIFCSKFLLFSLPTLALEMINP